MRLLSRGRLDAGRYIEAAELYRVAGAADGLTLAIGAFAAQPFMLVPASDALRMATIARHALGELGRRQVQALGLE